MNEFSDLSCQPYLLQAKTIWRVRTPLRMLFKKIEIRILNVNEQCSFIATIPSVQKIDY